MTVPFKAWFVAPICTLIWFVAKNPMKILKNLVLTSENQTFENEKPDPYPTPVDPNYWIEPYPGKTDS